MVLPRLHCVLVLALFVFIGCNEPITEVPAPLWSAAPSDGRTRYFSAFRSGDYASLAPIISTLTAEHLDGDRVSTAVLGFAHAWRLAESSRTGGDPTVIESASVAHRMFEGAYGATSNDPRLLGFQGSMMMSEGSINANPELSREGYFLARTSAAKWPQWGLFTLAYSLSGQPPESALGVEAIDSMWRNLEVCAEGRSVNRTETGLLTWFAEASKSPNPLVARACGNQAVAPFNTEGFFAVFGDLLARKGDVTQATRMYATALSTEASAKWPYRSAIERRRDQVVDLKERWAEEPRRGLSQQIDEVTLFKGPANCTLCHQQAN